MQKENKAAQNKLLNQTGNNACRFLQSWLRPLVIMALGNKDGPSGTSVGNPNL
jgi:hypothetical protein